MSERPFIFVSTCKVKDGKLAEYKENLSQLVRLVEDSEPRLISFNVYLDEEGQRTTIVQVHPDAASMGFHMNVVSEHMSEAGDYLEEESTLVCGPDSDGVVDTIRRWTSSSAPFTLMPVHAVGFTRSNAR